MTGSRIRHGAKRAAPIPDAERKADQRRREALGLQQVTTEPHYNRLVAAMLKVTLLNDETSLDKRRVEAAATAILNEWADRWIKQ